MKKSNKKRSAKINRDNPNVMGLHAEIQEQEITDTLELNYMPYAMSVIVSRAIPEIDGFKPSHRKLLYTMYLMHLLNGSRTKSANVVGQTMRLNPHGDAAIYETMVRLSRGNGALLHPLVDSKGNFGKVYSRDMAYAASRYTEVKLDAICKYLFQDIDKDTVDLEDNYDSTMKEPKLLPTAFPNILVSANQGIAVGMASNLCGFNLAEVCDAAIARMKHPNCDLMDILKGPDFPTGGQFLYDQAELEKVYRTGRGSLRIRAKWRYLPEENLIEIYEIPYSTTVEVIMDKVADLIKSGKVTEIADMRDETDLSGLKLTIDLKKRVDPDKLMAKLNRMTTLTDTFGCNFNILIAGNPQVLGVGQILDEWTAWRMDCVRRRVYFDMNKKKEKLHLLEGLKKILLDIDEAIRIIRETESEAEVVPNLMLGFGIDEIQAEYVAEIKLRNINREFILKRTGEVDALTAEIADLEDTVTKPKRIQKLIIGELEQVKKEFAIPRRTEIVYDHMEEEEEPEEAPAAQPVHLFLSTEGYLKKISPQSLRMSGEQKYKEGDSAFLTYETDTNAELLVFSDRQQCYKQMVSAFSDSKASVLGDYLPSVLGMEDGEKVVFALPASDFQGSLLFCFTNGKIARIDLSAYQTQTRRKKLTGAYSDKAELACVLYVREEQEYVLYTSDGRAVVFSSALLAPKATRSSQGVNVMTAKKNRLLTGVRPLSETPIQAPARYRAKSLPSAGALLKPEDRGEEQITL